MNQEASRPVSRQISELSPIFARTKKIKLMGNSPKYSPPPTVAEKIHILILKLWESATELSSLKSFHCTSYIKFHISFIIHHNSYLIYTILISHILYFLYDISYLIANISYLIFPYITFHTSYFISCILYLISLISYLIF